MKLKKSLGQNFLNNEIISYNIVKNVLDLDCKNILEIGCGAGALTRFLNEKNWKKFYIVEYDNFWAKNADLKFKNAKVFCKNILDFNFTDDNDKWIIIGNIPYNITYGILKRIIYWRNKLEKVVIMVQEEVAQKLNKKNGKDYGPISVLIQLFFDIILLEKVLPENFTPAPKVTSRVISLTPKINSLIIENFEEFKDFLSIIFKSPRKKIKNNIINSKYENLIPLDILEKRAQELKPEFILNLFLTEIFLSKI